MKRLTMILMLLALLLGTASARETGLVYHEIQVVDELGEKVTTISSVEIYTPDTTTNQTIYQDRNKKNAITLPMATSSTNTTLSNGYFYWYGADGYDFSITDGTNVATNANHRTRTSSEGTLVFPSYLTAISSSAYLDAESITMGTSLDWVINAGTSADLITFTPATDSTSVFSVGTTAKTADFRVWGATAGYDMQWDASRNMLAFRDSAVLGFGGAATSAAADFTIYHTAATGVLTITAVAADETIVFGDETIATDVKFDNTTTAGADVWWDDSSETWHFGATNIGVDVKFWGDTAGVYALWDEDADEMVFVTADLKISQTSQIEFIDATDSLTDWTIDNATDETLLILPTETTDDQSINLGNATNTTDLRLFGATASTVVFDASGDLVTFTDYDVLISDADYLYFGADKDFSVHSTTTKYLTFTPLAATDDYGVTFGADETGCDIKAFGKTTGEYIAWDASADSLTVVGDLMLVTATGTTVPIRLDATGTVAAGNAIELETTSGPIQILADGASTGDITLDAQDTITLVSTDNGVAGIYLHLNGGTSETIKIHSDLGTGDESIHLASDAGGITINAAAGSVDIEAVGAEDGDIGINAGDDMTITAAGDLTFAVTGSMTLPANVLLKSVTDVTAAEVNDLADTPKELVAAVAGKVHEFVYAIMAYDYGTVAWTEPSAPDDMCIRYTNGSGPIVSALMDATATGLCDAEDTVTFVPPVSDTVGGTTAMVGVLESACTNSALVLHNTGTDYTGNGDGALRVIVYYRSHTTAELGL